VLDELDRVRARAFARADPALLARVYATGSGAGRTDAAALASLAASGRTATGVRHEVRRVQEEAAGVRRAELRVVDVLRPHVVRGADGQALQQRPGRGEAAHRVVLVRTAAGWRIAQLRRG